MKKGSVSIMLILVIVMLTIVTTAAVALAISTMRDTTTHTLGERTLAVAESGAEAAILELLRDPSYNPLSPNNTLAIGSGIATISVTGTSPKIITSTGTIGLYTRVVQVSITNTGGLLTVSNWQEL